MKNKKLLILCQYFYPEYVSSATLPTQMAEDLVNRGMKVDVISGWPYEYSNEKIVQKKTTYKGINIQRLKYTKFNNKSKIGRICNFFSLFLMFIFKMPKMLKYDHILVYSNPPILPLIPDVLHRLFKKKY
ncbi:glycosyltransferase WbuB, partial [Staphylococcus aureus]|nr:glycosyltransferase WbuB [Staphylococcus aureus]